MFERAQAAAEFLTRPHALHAWQRTSRAQAGVEFPAHANKRTSRAQAAVEFLTLLAFFLAFVIPFALIIYDFSGEKSEKVAMEQASQSARKLADAADSVYIQGAGSSVSTTVFVPAYVKNIQIGGPSGREIIFTLKTSNGISDVVAITGAQLSGRSLGAYSAAGSKPVRVYYDKTRKVVDVEFAG